MIRRNILIALVTSLAVSVPLKAQSEAITGGSIAVAYGVLSIGAIGTMISMSDAAPVDAGSKIRIGGDGAGSRVGRVLSVNAGRVMLETDAGQTTISADSLGEIEVSLGNSGRWAQGWGIGFASGAGIGALIGFASGDDPPGTFIRLNAEQKALVAGSVLAVGGSLVGTLIGLAGPERWVHATRPGETSRVSISPIVGSRVGLSAKFAF